jgi:two-component system, chemotaxis family, protein-glutamate methylesterase/glutaminase
MEIKHRLLVIGGSAGSLHMVLKILPMLKKEMPLAVILVFHRKSGDDKTLLEVLSTRTAFDVKEVEDKDDIHPGVIYLAPPDYHVLVEKDKSLTLDDSEKLNYSRPSIDATFETASEVYGKSSLCMLLSGANADGVAGLSFAKKQGSFIIIQDPSTAEAPYMPQHAVDVVKADLIWGEENLMEVRDSLFVIP